MARFVYEAKVNPNEVVKGALMAEDRNAAIKKVVQMGYYVISLEEEADPSKATNPRSLYFFERITLKNITNFTRQLSDLLESGLTIIRALDILHNQTENRKFKTVISDIRDFCVDGNPLSAALARHPGVFSNLYVSMVRSGETGGALENILKRLADFNEKQLEVVTKIRTALAYPILMSVVGCATIIILITFVIPKMMVMFGDLGQALPLPTRILLGISDAITRYWWIIIGIIAAAVMSLAKTYKSHEGKTIIDKFLLKIPLVGPMIKKVEIARFSRTLATLLNNGVPILESLRVISETIGNTVMRQEISAAYAAVREGGSLAGGLSSSATIPLAAINMIAVGEEGGHLERSLFKVAEGFERESDEAIKMLMALLEPILILVLGTVVGFIVISMLLPIFEINFLIR